MSKWKKEIKDLFIIYFVCVVVELVFSFFENNYKISTELILGILRKQIIYSFTLYFLFRVLNSAVKNPNEKQKTN